MTTKQIATAAAAAIAMGGMDDLKKAVVKTRQTTKAIGFDPFLRFSKGDWLYGSDNVDVEKGSRWAINPVSFKTGFTCWTNYPDSVKRKNENLGKVMAPIGADPIDPKTLETFYPEDEGMNNGQPWAWAQCLEVTLVCISGEDKGQEVLYSTNSYGGVKLLDGYLTELMKRVDEGTPVAIVELSGSAYTHKQYGRTYNPEFVYVDWVAPDSTKLPSAPEAEEEEPEPASGKTTTRRSRPAPSDGDAEAGAEVGGEAPAPTRSRRRPAA